MTSTVKPITLEVGQGEIIYLSKTWYQIWKATGETTNELMDTWFEIVPPQIGPPEHMHARYNECFWVVKGTFLFKVAGQTTKLSEGGWVFIPGGAHHGFRNIGTEEGQLLIESFPGGGMSKYFKEVSVVMASQPPDQEALNRVDAKYGIMPVGPPLEADAK